MNIKGLSELNVFRGTYAECMAKPTRDMTIYLAWDTQEIFVGNAKGVKVKYGSGQSADKSIKSFFASFKDTLYQEVKNYAKTQVDANIIQLYSNVIDEKYTQLEKQLNEHAESIEGKFKKQIDDFRERLNDIVNILRTELESIKKYIKEDVSNSLTKLEGDISDKYYTKSDMDFLYYSKADIEKKIAEIASGGEINLEGFISNETFLIEKNNLKNTMESQLSNTESRLSNRIDSIDSTLNFITKDAPEAFDTLREIATYISEDKTGASAMLAKIDANTNSISSIDDKVEITKSSVASIDSYTKSLNSTLTDYMSKNDTAVSKIGSNLENNYYNKDEVDQRILDFVTSGNIDLSNYYNKDAIDIKFLNTNNEISSNKERLSNIENTYSTKEYVDSKVGSVDVSTQLIPYAKTSEVNSKLEAYATKTYVDEAVSKIDVTSQLGSYATKDHVAEEISKIDVTSQLGEYATKSYVTEEISKIDVTDQLDAYATKEYVDEYLEDFKVDVTEVTADKVTFKEDIVITEAFGNYTPDSNGSFTIPTNTNKMTLESLLISAFSKEKNPSVTQPTLSISSSALDNSYEVGTYVNVSYSFSHTPGSYQYGPATGVVWEGFKAKFNNVTVSGTSGSFGEILVGDSTNLKLTGEATHSDGVIPLTNLKNEYLSGKIVSKTVSVEGKTLSGYRKMFFGTMTSKPTVMTSSHIRNLASSSAVANVSDKSVTIPVGAYRVIIAVPTNKTLTKVLDVNDSNSNIVGSFKKATVNVEGANGYESIEYSVYYLDYANANNTQNTYKVTIS